MALGDLATLYRRARASGFCDETAWDFATEQIDEQIENLRVDMKLRNLAARVEMLGGRAAVDAVVKGLSEDAPAK